MATILQHGQGLVYSFVCLILVFLDLGSAPTLHAANLGLRERRVKLGYVQPSEHGLRSAILYGVSPVAVSLACLFLRLEQEYYSLLPV